MNNQRIFVPGLQDRTAHVVNEKGNVSVKVSMTGWTIGNSAEVKNPSSGNLHLVKWERILR